MREAEVVIVGAGIAGLTAALRLVEAGRSVAVVEARSRTGGRIHGLDLGGVPVQLGGRWTGPGQDAIAALAGELGIAIRGFQAFDDIGQRPLADQERFVAAAREIDAAAADVPLDAPWRAPDAVRRDSMTLETWLVERFGATLATALGATLAGFLPEARECSLLHAQFYLRSNGGLAGILGLDGPAHDSAVFEGGAHAVSDALAARLGETIHLGEPVHLIERGAEGVAVHARRQRWHARHAVVTVPPVLTQRIAFDPPLPALRDYLLQRMPIRGKIAVAAVYETPLDPAPGSGFTDNIMAWNETVGAAPMSIAGLMSIARSRALWGADRATLEAAVRADLAEAFGAAAGAPDHLEMIDWAAEPWSRGCNSYLTTGAWTSYGAALRPPVGRIHWAGAEISAVFVGQMEGAVRTAEAAVAAILESGTGERPWTSASRA